MLKKHGSVVGGEIYSQRGIDVINLGSPSGTKTYITVGTDFLVRKKIRELEEIIKFCTGNLVKIDTTLKPILMTLKEESDASRFNNAIVKKTLAKRKELQNQKKK
jgi:uncharacterized protein (DUF342 family)